MIPAADRRDPKGQELLISVAPRGPSLTGRLRNATTIVSLGCEAEGGGLQRRAVRARRTTSIGELCLDPFSIASRVLRISAAN